MFEDSTKVVIVSSSHTKGIGPRIGSVGYATPYRVDKTAFLPQQTQFINGLVLFATKVSFIKYGYEKERPKHEVKTLIGAIPIVNELKKNDETENILRTYIDKLPKTDFNSHLWLKTKLNLLNRTDNVNICILIPTSTNNFDLRTCSSMEFAAWFKSIMSRSKTRASIHNIVSNQIYLSKLPTKNLITIGEHFKFYFKLKSNEDAFLDYMLESNNRRVELIKFLKIVKPIYSKGVFTVHKRVMSRLLANSSVVYKRGSNQVNLLFCKLIDCMFIDNIFNWKLNTLRKSKVVRNGGSIATKIKKTKEVLRSMANEINNK